MGTGWGALSETYDFLVRLKETEEQFPSPTDFVGSVHNGPASQVAIRYHATGANITTSGGDYSFEQALLTADQLTDDDDHQVFVLGADEGHPEFSHLFDQSIGKDSPLVDGGCGFCLAKTSDLARQTTIKTSFYGSCRETNVLESLIETLGGADMLAAECGLLMIGIPAAFRRLGDEQFSRLIDLTGLKTPVIEYRKIIGEFASASAVAAVMAVEFLDKKAVPAGLAAFGEVALDKKGILVIGLGQYITAMEISVQ